MTAPLSAASGPSKSTHDGVKARCLPFDAAPSPLFGLFGVASGRAASALLGVSLSRCIILRPTDEKHAASFGMVAAARNPVGVALKAVKPSPTATRKLTRVSLVDVSGRLNRFTTVRGVLRNAQPDRRFLRSRNILSVFIRRS